MKILCECGIVKAREEGKWTYYSLDDDTISKTKQFFCAITSNKEKCICKDNSICCKGCNENE
jgi:ArsR family transcriptional regulator